MTLAELKDAILGYSHRSDFSADLFLPTAVERINNDLRSMEQVTLFQLNPVTNPSPLPDDFLEMRSVETARTGGGTVSLTKISRKDLNRYTVGGITGAPTFYTIDGKALQYVPDDPDVLLTLRYYAAVSLPETDEGTTATLTRYPGIYLQAALIDLYDYTDNSKKQQEAQAKYSQLVAMANNASRMGEAAESLQMNGTAGW